MSVANSNFNKRNFQIFSDEESKSYESFKNLIVQAKEKKEKDFDEQVKIFSASIYDFAFYRSEKQHNPLKVVSDPMNHLADPQLEHYLFLYLQILKTVNGTLTNGDIINSELDEHTTKLMMEYLLTTFTLEVYNGKAYLKDA